MSSFFSSLRVRLLLLVLLSALPALGLTLYSGIEQRRLAANAAQQDTLRTARLAANSQQALIEGAHQLLISLSQVPQVQSGEGNACQSFLSGLIKQYPNYAVFSVAQTDGSIFCTSSSDSHPVNIADRSYFQQVLKTSQFVIGDYITDRITGKAVLPFAYPVFDSSGSLERVLVAALDLSWVNQLASAINLPPQSSLLIVDNDGTILARYPEPEKYVGQKLAESPIIQTIVQARGEGTAEVEGLDGISRLYAFTPLTHSSSGGNAFVAIGVPTNIAYAGVNQLLIRNLSALIVVTLLALVFAVLISDLFILNRVKSIIQATGLIAAGNLSARVGLKNETGELGQMARDFDLMADKLQEREELLRSAEARYRSLVEEIPAVIYSYSIGEHSRPLYISPQVQEILGYSAEEWMSDQNLWSSRIFAQDCATVTSNMEQARKNGEDFQAEYRFRARSERLIWLRDEAVVVKDPQGRSLLLQGFLLDITDRKKAEAAMKVYAARLERSNQELQDFAYISSHDLQEPLRKIQAFGERLKVKFREQLSGDGQDYIDRMQNAAARMQAMINDLLLYSRVSTQARSFILVNLNDCVREVISDLETRIAETGGSVEIADLPIIEAEPVQMRQLLQNLIGNALKFHQKNRPPVVKVSSKIIPAQDWRFTPTAQISFEDNGIGFDEKYLDRIFQPFQRLESRSEYEGSGIGLAICRKIVERHGGGITARSAPGQGTTFIVTLPVKQNEKGEQEIS